MMDSDSEIELPTEAIKAICERTKAKEHLEAVLLRPEDSHAAEAYIQAVNAKVLDYQRHNLEYKDTSLVLPLHVIRSLSMEYMASCHTQQFPMPQDYMINHEEDQCCLVTQWTEILTSRGYPLEWTKMLAEMAKTGHENFKNSVGFKKDPWDKPWLRSCCVSKADVMRVNKSNEVDMSEACLKEEIGEMPSGSSRKWICVFAGGDYIYPWIPETATLEQVSH